MMEYSTSRVIRIYIKNIAKIINKKYMGLYRYDETRQETMQPTLKQMRKQNNRSQGHTLII